MIDSDINNLIELIFPDGEIVLENGQHIEFIKDKAEFDKRIAGQKRGFITTKKRGE